MYLKAKKVKISCIWAMHKLVSPCLNHGLLDFIARKLHRLLLENSEIWQIEIN